MARGRVLLVDDEPSVLASYGRALADAGFEVTKAGGGDEALRRLETDRFDVVLSDLLLPEKAGLEFLESLQAISPELPVIVMAGKQSNEIAVEAAELGAVQYLLKPISKEVLTRTIRHVVGRNRKRRETAPEMRARRGDARGTVKMTATHAKNQMGQVLELVMGGGTVLITKREIPKVAVIPMAEYEKYSRATDAKLDALSGEFDALLERMQTPEARAGMKEAFDASPEQLAKAALEFARKRG